MIKIYADLVESGERSLNGENGVTKVPDKYLNQVIKELESRGYFKEATEQTQQENKLLIKTRSN